VLPTYIPSFAIGAFIGLVMNSTLAMATLISSLIYRKYLPLRYVCLFFISLTTYFLGYVLYCYEFSEEWVLFWYRILLLGLIWMPVTWLFFLYSMRGTPAGWPAKALLVWGLATTAIVFLVQHPAVNSGPLQEFAGTGVSHPQSWFVRPMVYFTGLCVNLVSIIVLWRILWPTPERRKFAYLLVAGLSLWMIAGVHDAFYTMGWHSPFKGTMIWWGSVCLSVCLALTVAFLIRHLELELATSREQFVKAFQASPGWMVVSTLEDGLVLEVNDTLVRDTGFEREDIVGRSTLTQGLWVDVEQRQKGIQTLLSGQSLRDQEVSVRVQGDRNYTLSWSGELIQWGGQQALLSIFQDITNRKRAEEEIVRHKQLLEHAVARRTEELTKTNLELQKEISERQRTEQALRESQGNLQRLFDSLQDFLFVIAPNGQLLHANQQAMKRLGYSMEQLRGMQFLELHPPARRQEVSYIMEDIFAGRTDTCKVPLLTKSDETIPVETIVTMGRWNRSDALFGISRDVSDRVRSEETLNQLAAGVAHNFNNLLAAVIGNAQAARSELDKPHYNQIKLMRLVDNVVRSADSGRNVVQRLAAYVGRRQPGDEPRQAVDLAEALASAVEIASAAFRHMGMNGVNVILDLPGGLFVEAQRSELMEVFLNLIKNAVEAMPQGGQMSIRAWAEDGNAQVSIKDTGTGMDESTRSRVFQPFFSTKGVSGQGLGLASSRGILRSLGGDISAFSQPQSGTTISLRLPLSRPTDKVSIAKGVHSIPPGLNVLLVEDEALVAMGLTASLEDAGLKVSLATRVHEAMTFLEQGLPDLLLCDLGLPDGTGWEVAARMAELAAEGGQEAPATIMLTGWAADSKWDKSPEGMDLSYSILHKPVDRALLLDSIAKVLTWPLQVLSK
jgi:PAS domain S-box-containing protein